jgi:hypothetical protein
MFEARPPELEPKREPARAEPAKAAPKPSPVEEAAAGLFEAGIRFLESLAPSGSRQALAGSAAEAVGRAVSTVFQKDPRTNRPALSIPLPATITQDRLVGAISGLLSSLAGRV